MSHATLNKDVADFGTITDVDLSEVKFPQPLLRRQFPVVIGICEATIYDNGVVYFRAENSFSFGDLSRMQSAAEELKKAHKWIVQPKIP